jgi:hypothetical protein
MSGGTGPGYIQARSSRPTGEDVGITNFARAGIPIFGYC